MDKIKNRNKKMNKIQEIIKENNLIIPKKEETEKYDKDGNIIWEKSPNGFIWEYRYKDGNKIWEKSPNGNEHWYEDDEELKLENGNYYLNGILLEKKKNE